MDLYLFNANDSAAMYGIGTYLQELTNVLINSDTRIHIVHLHSARPVFEIVKTERIEHWYIPEVRNQNTFSGSIQKLEDYCRNIVYLLRLYIKDTKELIFHFNFNQYQLLAKELKATFNCKTVTTIHFLKWAFEFQGNLSKLHTLKSKSEDKRNSYEVLLLTTDEYEGLLYREVDRVIALSQDMKKLICREYHLNPKNISVIPNGLSDSELIQINNRDNLRRKWCFSENEPLILFAGRLHPVKGLLFLIKAFRKVLEVIPDCRLLIAGSGHFDTYLQEAKDISTKIIFTGFLEKKELYELYQISDAGVVPSLYEPFGYVAVEMMMHELPIVATETSGLNEVVDDSCGLKIPIIIHPDRVEIDTNLLAEKIIFLLQHPVEAKAMGENGRRRYKQLYSSKIMRRNMLNLYNSLYNTENNISKTIGELNKEIQ